MQLNAAITRLAENFERFSQELRNMTDDVPVDAANDEYQEREAYDEQEAYDEDDDRPKVREDIDDDSMVTLRSGDLRKVLNSYRRLSRYAREGRIPTMEQRLKLHENIKKVKHLVRRPIH